MSAVDFLVYLQNFIDLFDTKLKHVVLRQCDLTELMELYSILSDQIDDPNYGYQQHCMNRVTQIICGIQDDLKKIQPWLT
jgi:hypothetical protein